VRLDGLVYRRDRMGFIEEGYTHIFIVPAEGGTARQVTRGNRNQGGGGCSWTRDGEEILFSSLRVEDAEYEYRESEIYAVTINSGEIRQLRERKGPDVNTFLVIVDNSLNRVCLQVALVVFWRMLFSWE